MRHLLLIITILSAALGAVAQVQPTEARRTFLAATTARDAERDLAGAAKLFAKVGGDGRAPADLRTRAWLEAGRCYADLGEATSAKAAFEVAAEGDGPAAQEARNRLAGKPDEAAKLVRARVEKAIQRLRTNPEQTSKLASELAWIGSEAVPFLTSAIKAERDDLTLVKAASKVVATLGGKDAAAFADHARSSPDLVWRGAVIAGLTAASVRPGTPLAQALLTLADDPRATVRAAVVANLFDSMSWERIESALIDPAANVRSLAWNMLYARQWAGTRSSAFNLEAILRHVAVGLEDESSDVQREASKWVLEFWDRPESQALFLQACGSKHRAHLFPRPWPIERQWSRPELSKAWGEPFASAPPHAEVLAAALRLPTINTATSANSIPAPQAQIVLVMSKFVAACLEQWNEDAVETVAKFVELGYGWIDEPPLVRWLAEKGGDKGLVRLSQQLGALRHPYDALAVMSQHHHLPMECFDGLAAMVRHPWTQPDASPARHGVSDVGFSLAARTQDPRFPALVDELYEFWKAPDARPSAALFDTFARYRGPRLGPVLAKFAALKQMDLVRDRLIMLMVLHGHDDPQSYVSVCRFDSKRSSFSFDFDFYAPEGEVVEILEAGPAEIYQGQGLDWFGETWKKEHGPIKTISPENLAKIIEACVTHEDSEIRARAWAGFLSAAGASRSSYNTKRLSKTALAVLYRHALKAPDAAKTLRAFLGTLESREGPVDDLQLALFDEAAKDEHKRVFRDAWRGNPGSLHNPKYRDRFVELLKQDRHTDIAMRPLLWKADATILRIFEKLLKHESSMVRRLALQGLEQNAPEIAISNVSHLLRDEDATIVRRGIELARQSLHPDAIPGLIELLRSPSSDLGARAHDALAAITFYTEQKSKWERIRKGGGLDAVTAAEALIKQARTGDKQTRIAAIRSLGTLAVPETLPVLISWMKDKDADIAKAASDAARRINEKK